MHSNLSKVYSIDLDDSQIVNQPAVKPSGTKKEKVLYIYYKIKQKIKNKLKYIYI